MGFFGYFNRFISHIVRPLRNLLYWSAKLIPGLKKLGSLSLAARLSIALFFILIISTIVSAILSHYTKDTAIKIKGGTFWLLISLSFVTPIIFYIAIRMWQSAKTLSRFPDIDRAWEMGIEAIKAQGIDTKWVPFFLVLGARDEQAARHLMDAASMNFIIANIPDGPAAIHWYASEEAVFIVPNGVGCLSKLAQVEQQALARRSARAEPMPQNPTTGGGTIVAGSGQSNWNSPSEESSLARAITTTVQPGAPCYGKTIAPDALPATPTIRLPESDKHEQRTRLHYFCELISKHRAPIVPVNGVLTIIPFSSIHQSASTVQTASEDDLSTIRAQFQVRCPAILLVTEMQQEYGFLELTKRIGPMQAKESRFGQKYDHQNPPESEQLHALGWHACGFIKDWIYELFRAPDALKRFQGNTRLFALLCKIRGNFMAGLSQILANSFGYDADRGKDLEEEQFYFAGCYFASTGAKDDEKSFVKSVIRRMLELQSDLSWTPKALAEDERYHAYSNITVFFAMICLVILIVLLGDYFKWWS